MISYHKKLDICLTEPMFSNGPFIIKGLLDQPNIDFILAINPPMPVAVPFDDFVALAERPIIAAPASPIGDSLD